MIAGYNKSTTINLQSLQVDVIKCDLTDYDMMKIQFGKWFHTILSSQF